MASIISDPGGRKRIQFINGNGERKTIRLGRATMKQAERIKPWVDSLARGLTDPDAMEWVEDCEDWLHKKLAAAKLVKPREATHLGPWLDRYLAGRQGDLKASSIEKLKITRDKLLAYFKPATPLNEITPDQASEWRQRLRCGDAEGNGKLAEASVKHHVGNAKGFFSEAKHRGLIPANPFEHLESGATAAKNDRYVTPDETGAILSACPEIRWKVLFGLARLAGLRCPSETHLLRWGDIDYGRNRLTVRSPKTERHKGHEQRMVPIVPKLMGLLQDALLAAPEGQEYIVTMRGHGHLNDGLQRIIKRAQVQPWPRLWQTLRSSCEKEWAMTFPQYAVSRWIGHSITVSGKHYANSVPDELFDKASEGDGKLGNMSDGKRNGSAGQAAHREAHSAAEQQEVVGAGNTKSPVFPGFSEGFPSVQVAGGGFEPPTSGL